MTNRLALFALCLYVFTMPWEHSTDIGPGIGSICRIMGILAMIAGMGAVLTRGSLRRLTTFHGTVAIFYFLVVASLFWTVDSDATATAIRSFGQAMFVVWLLWEFAPEMAQRRRLMFSYIAGGYVTSYLTIHDFLSMGTITHNELRVSAEGWNPNELAIVLSIGIPFAALLIRNPSKVAVRLVALGYLLIAPATIVLTASRGGAIAMTIAGLSVVLILGEGSARRKIVAAVLMGMVLAAAATFVPRNSWDRLTTIGAEINGGGMNDRLPIWQAGLRMFSASGPNVAVGVGADGFKKAVDLGYVAHNTYISILVNNGLIGFALFLGILAQAGRAGFRSVDPERKVILFSLLCWMVAIAAGSWDHNRVAWFLLAISYTAGAQRSSPYLAAIERLALKQQTFIQDSPA
jgi:O-antigen ligase